MFIKKELIIKKTLCSLIAIVIISSFTPSFACSCGSDTGSPEPKSRCCKIKARREAAAKQRRAEIEKARRKAATKQNKETAKDTCSMCTVRDAEIEKARRAEAQAQLRRTRTYSIIYASLDF